MRSVQTILSFPGAKMSEEELIQSVESALDRAELCFDLDVAVEVDGEPALALLFIHVVGSDECLTRAVERAVDKAGMQCDIRIISSKEEQDSDLGPTGVLVSQYRDDYADSIDIVADVPEDDAYVYFMTKHIILGNEIQISLAIDIPLDALLKMVARRKRLIANGDVTN